MTTPAAPAQDVQDQAAQILAGVFAKAGASPAEAAAAARGYITEAVKMMAAGDFTAPADTATVAGAWNPAAHPRAPAGTSTGGQFAPATGGGTDTRPVPTNQRPVGRGATGQQVIDLQKRLNALGAKPPLKVDGKFGPLTLAAVEQFQRTHKDAQGRPLKVDGLVGPLTTGALRTKTSSTARKTSTRKTSTGGGKTGTGTRKKTSTKKTGGGKTGTVKLSDKPGSATATQKTQITREISRRKVPAGDASDFRDDFPILAQSEADALLKYITKTYPLKPAPVKKAAAGTFRPELHPRRPDGKFTSLDTSGGRHAGPGSFEHIRSIESLADEIDTAARASGTGQSETAAALRNVARHVAQRQIGVARTHMAAARSAARREHLSGTHKQRLREIADSLGKIPAGTYPEPGFGEETTGRPAPWALQRHTPAGPGYFPGRVRHAAAPKFYTDKAGKRYPVPPRPAPGTPPTPAQQQADRDSYEQQLQAQITQIRAQLDGNTSQVPRGLLELTLAHLQDQLAQLRKAKATTAPDPRTAAAAAIADLGLDADAASLAAEIAAWNDVAHGRVTAAESAGWQRNKGNSSRLHDYWAHGEGAAKIRWGTQGDWYRCRDLLRKYIADPEGYCEKMHKEVTGMTTSQHAEEDRGGKKAAAGVLAFKPSELRNRLGEWSHGGNPGKTKGEDEHQAYARSWSQLAADIGETRSLLPASHPAADYLRDAQHSAGKESRRPGGTGLDNHASAAEGDIEIAQARHESLPGGTAETAARISQHLAAVKALREQRRRLFPEQVFPPPTRYATAGGGGTGSPASGPPGLPALVTIPGVDILAAGTWQLSTGRQTFTAGDLQSAIDASVCPAVGLPVIKIGHLDPRFAPQPEHDGEPALGRVHNLRLSGNGTKIIGDLAGVPGWLGAIAASAFPRRSVEGKYGFKCQIGHDHPFAITGLALLGVTAPGVGVLGELPDIASLYGLTAATAQAGQAWRTEQDQEGHVMAVTEEDVRRSYYATAGAPQSWWITELQMYPPQLIVADETSGKIYRVGYRIDGSAVAFDPPAEIASYADVAAARGTGPVVAYASAAESRAVTAAGSWDAAAAVRNLGDNPSPAAIKAMFAVPGESKSDSKLPHHDVSGGQVGGPNPAACSAAIAALNGGRGGLTGMPAADKRAAYNHLAGHLKAMGRTPPEFAGAAASWDGEDEAQVEWGLGWLAAAYGRGDPPGRDVPGTEPGTTQEPGSFAARVSRLIDIRAAAGDADADDTVQGLIASLDATLDQAAQLAAQVDPKTVPESAGQVLALVTAAEAIADQLMDLLGIYDPDDTDDDGQDTAAAAAGDGEGDTAGTAHGAYDGDHEHPHPAYGSQGGDATHTHKHTHSGDGRHDHAHDTNAAAAPAAATQEEGISGMGYEFSTQQMAAIRARLGKSEGEEVTAGDIAAVFGAPVPPFPVQAAAAGTSGDGPVEVPVIADGVHLVEANILRKYQEEALAGRRAVRAMHVAERDTILASAIKEGKFAQSQLEHFRTLWDRDPDGTRKLVASLAGGLVPVIGPMGSNGEWATDPDMPGDFEAQSAYRLLYPEDTKGGVERAPGVRTR